MNYFIVIRDPYLLANQQKPSRELPNYITETQEVCKVLFGGFFWFSPKLNADYIIVSFRFCYGQRRLCPIQKRIYGSACKTR
jgi:hypothetical protein